MNAAMFFRAVAQYTSMRTGPLVLAWLLLPAFLAAASANPIPVPSLGLSEELITITIVKADKRAVAEVGGVYPFTNMGYDRVTMYFPVPPNVDRDSIEVLVNGRRVAWDIVDTAVVQLPGGQSREITYDTVLGRYVFIRWVVENPGEKFTVTVRYSHPAESEDGALKALYAMATGRFYYSKTCTARVKLVLKGFAGQKLSVSLVGSEGRGTTRFTITARSGLEIVSLEERSDMFRGLDRDLLITVGPEGPGGPSGLWVPADPSKVRAEVKASVRDREARVNVTLVYPHGGFREEWADPVVSKDRVYIDVKVYEWTGPAIQVITVRKRSFVIALDPGRYDVVVRVNGVEVARVPITVESGVSLGLVRIPWVVVLILLVALAAAVLFIALSVR